MSSAPSPASQGETVSFRDLDLHEAVLKALSDVGYESPSPIQAATIPRLLEGRDVLGQAQTGTGKTAAFALPLLSQIDLSQRVPQGLVLVPTRELAIQVAEAFQRYAAHLQGFHVVPIYGGQSYVPQLKSLRRGVHVIVGTPGRVMDHIQRETMKLDTLKHLVLDEADEMLRMGFIDAVEWILDQAPEERQIALFSATMPPEVRRIAQKHLHNPAEVTIKSKTSTAANIRQRYWIVGGMHKLDALTRILEVEPFDGMLVFTRTKLATNELAERLGARGFAVEALHGDIAQAQRERTVARLKAGQIDIVVATDVAARGLDVERISHVINYDVPHDPESYIHRIGRTGRAGRSGEAILFIAPRERNMLRVIERATRQNVTQMELPTTEDVNEQRVRRFNERIQAVITAGDAEPFRAIIQRFETENNVPAVEIAAALAFIAQGKKPLLLEASPQGEARWEKGRRGDRDGGDAGRGEGWRAGRDGGEARRNAGQSEGWRADRDGGKARNVGRDAGWRAGRDGGDTRNAEQGNGWGAGRDSADTRNGQRAGETGNVGKGHHGGHFIGGGRNAHRDADVADGGGHEARDPASRKKGRRDDEHPTARPETEWPQPVAIADGEPRLDETQPDAQDAGGEIEQPKRPRHDDDSPRPSARHDDDSRHGSRDNEVMETYRVEVGREHGVAPGNIMGAIANEADLPGKRIGRIVIREDHSFVDLPTGMPKEIFLRLQKVIVSGQKLRISRALKAHVQKLRAGREGHRKGKRGVRH